VFHISIWGAWGFVLGAKPTKTRCGNGTVSRSLRSPSTTLTQNSACFIRLMKGWWHRSFFRFVPKCSGGCCSPKIFEIHSFDCKYLACCLGY